MSYVSYVLLRPSYVLLRPSYVLLRPITLYHALVTFYLRPITSYYVLVTSYLRPSCVILRPTLCDKICCQKFQIKGILVMFFKIWVINFQRLFHRRV